MKNIHIILMVLVLGWTAHSSAQTVLQHVYVLNEGAYGIGNGSLTKTNYPTYSESTTPVHNPSNFGTTLYAANNKLYAAYDTVIYVVEPTTMQKIDSLFIEGIRVAKVRDSILYVTRDTPPYFQAYNLNTKANLWGTAGLSGACEGFAFLTGNRAAVCVNAFGFQDTLAIIDLTNGAILQQYATALNPQDVYAHGNNVYVFCTANFTNSAITKIDLVSSTINTTNTGLISYGGMTVDTVYQKLYFIVTNGSFTTPKYWVKQFDLTSQTLIAGNTIDTVHADAIYSISYDHLNEQFFCGITDFFSFGKVNRYDKFGNLQDFFVTGVGPRSIVLQHGIGSQIADNNLSDISFTIYPNPAQSYIYINTEHTNHVQIWNSEGKLMRTQVLNRGTHPLDINDLPSGIYLIKLEQRIAKFIKL